MLGFRNESSPGSGSWAYHGDDGGIYRWPEDGQMGCSPPGRYGLKDTIGCGIDCKNGKIFYTKNGVRLSKSAKYALFLYFQYSDKHKWTGHLTESLVDYTRELA